MGFFDSVKKIAGPVTGSLPGTDTFLGNFGDTDDFLSMIPGIGDSMAAKTQNAANIKAAQNQMAFQERMSNTAYQRSMADMKKAGLNPMLAFSQGGASTPSGALPTINSETKSKLGEFGLAAATGLSNAATARQQANTSQASAEQGIDLSKAQTAKTIADADNTKTDTALKQRELKGRRTFETLDKAGGGIIQKIIDSISNSANSSRSLNKSDPLIRSHGPASKKESNSMFQWLQNKNQKGPK